jgi:TRAP-type C4-dicarboxylate transport system permease small subunit
MMVAIVVIVFAGVLFRYVFHIGLGWTEEAARFLLIWMTFVGATIAVRRWANFQLMIALHWIPQRWHRYLQFFSVAVVLAMSAVLVRYGIAITRISWFQTSPTMEWSMGYLYAIVPASGALMLGFALLHLAALLRGRKLPGADAHLPVHSAAGAGIDASAS